MDFELNEAQRVISKSAAQVLQGADAKAGESWAGETAWRALAKAGLLALTLPGWMDGDDLGVLDAAVLMSEVGRRAASMPALATIMLGALPVTRWGSRSLQELVLDGVGAGEVILTAGVREQSTVMPAEPATVAVLGDGGTGTITGTKVGVPYAGEANWILI